MKRKSLRYILLISVFLHGFILVYSQNDWIFKQEEIDKVNKQIFKLFKKSECNNQSDNVKIINVYGAIYNGNLSKSDLLSKDFLLNIEPAYFHYKSHKYLWIRSFIFENDGDLLAVSDGRHIYCLSNYNKDVYLEEEKLIKIITGLEFLQVFHLSLTPFNIYFAVSKKNEVYVMQVEDEQIEIYLLEDYVNNHWINISK